VERREPKEEDGRKLPKKKKKQRYNNSSTSSQPSPQVVRTITEYERAIQRAIQDNNTLRSNNNTLVTKLQTNDNELKQLKIVCMDMMFLVTELQQQHQQQSQQQQQQQQQQQDVSVVTELQHQQLPNSIPSLTTMIMMMMIKMGLEEPYLQVEIMV
jgi:chromosome segregation ATPase